MSIALVVWGVYYLSKIFLVAYLNTVSDPNIDLNSPIELFYFTLDYYDNS